MSFFGGGGEKSETRRFNGTERQTQTGRQTERQAGRQADRQTDRHTLTRV